MLLLRGGRILMGNGLGRKVVTDGAVLVDTENGVIEKCFTSASDTRVQDLLYQGVEERRLEANELLMPGLICAHGHFYGLFARGMNFLRPGEQPPAGFGEILKKLWWRLDRSLDLEATRLSTLSCLVSAIKSGTTTIIDHHSSPGFASRSLSVISKAARAAGVRCAVAFEVTDRNGNNEALRGIEENERAIDEALCNRDGMIAASFGLHASFTLEEDTLIECRRAQSRWQDVGFHVHLAEGIEDQQHSLASFSERTTYRLQRHGILGPHTVLGHGVHLNQEEMDLIKQSDSMLVTNVSSNANNGVGLPDVSRLMSKDILVGMGTDGMSYDMFNEYHHSYLAHKLVHKDPRAMPGDQLASMLLDNNAAIANRMFQPFGSKKLGSIEPGAAADLIIVDYPSPTPVHEGNFPWHMMFGMSSNHVKTTIIGGRFVYDNHRLLTLNESEIAHDALTHSAIVWERVANV